MLLLRSIHPSNQGFGAGFMLSFMWAGGAVGVQQRNL